jgi:hypothetical protein
MLLTAGAVQHLPSYMTIETPPSSPTALISQGPLTPSPPATADTSPGAFEAHSQVQPIPAPNRSAAWDQSIPLCNTTDGSYVPGNYSPSESFRILGQLQEIYDGCFSPFSLPGTGSDSVDFSLLDSLQQVASPKAPYAILRDIYAVPNLLQWTKHLSVQILPAVEDLIRQFRSRNSARALHNSFGLKISKFKSFTSSHSTGE